MALTRKHLFPLAAVTGLATMAIIGFLTYRHLGQVQETVELQPPPCDLNTGHCTVTIPGGGEALLAISPSPIPVMAPLRIRVTTSVLTASRASVDFSGEDMNMGLLHAELHGTEAGQFQGEIVLPVCVSGRMRWRATLQLALAHGAYRVPFRFEAPMSKL